MCFLKHIKHIDAPHPHHSLPNKIDKNDTDTEMLHPH